MKELAEEQTAPVSAREEEKTMNENDTDFRELTNICIAAHTLSAEEQYDKCLSMLAAAMAHHPDAPEPHNLMGLVLEHQGKHTSAMKHFRAALALDPTYRPARENLEKYGGVGDNRAAWQRADCGKKEEYSEWRFGRFVRRILCA